MRDFRPILNILGLLICIESIALLIPMFFDLLNNNPDWKQFFYISCLTFLIGLVLYVGFKKENIKINITVNPYFLDDQSEPEDQHFVWAYQVTIDNQSDEKVQ